MEKSSLDKRLIALLKDGNQEEAVAVYKEQTGEEDVLTCARYLTNLIEQMDPLDKEITKQNLKANQKGCGKIVLILVVFGALCALFAYYLSSK